MKRWLLVDVLLVCLAVVWLSRDTLLGYVLAGVVLLVLHRRWRIVRRQHPIVLGRVTDDGRLCRITVHTADPAHIDALEANGWAVMP